MTNYEKWLVSRIGTCKSGTPLDVPHHLRREDIETFLNGFSLEDLVDIFCMSEAALSRYRDSLEDRPELKRLQLINQYIRNELVDTILADTLVLQGLLPSPRLVQRGLTMLLG